MAMQALWHKIDPAEGREGKDWHQVALEAVDAAHALETDGIDGYHWKTERPSDEPEGIADGELHPESETNQEGEQ